MLGISLPRAIHKQSQSVWPGLSRERLIEELNRIRRLVLLYPAQGDNGPPPTATVLVEKKTLPQPSLAESLGLGELRRTLRG
jgi:hypothetical protein